MKVDWARVKVAAGVLSARPSGVFTRYEYQEQFGYGESQARSHIRSLLRSGKAERVFFREDGQKMVGYRLVEGK